MTKIAFLFPGQGAQHVGMGARLLAMYPSVRDLFERASEVLGYDLATLCTEGPIEKLDKTVYCQTAMFVTSLAAVEVLRAESPDVVTNCGYTAGLSLGEYTALTFSGVLAFEDAVRLVQKRATAMQEASDATPSGMVSVLGLDVAAVTHLCQQAKEEYVATHPAAKENILQVANLLEPKNIVVSGHNVLCEKISELAMAAGAMKTIPLAVAGAFHTAIMKPADDRLAVAIAGVHLNKPRIPVISNVDAMPHDEPEEIRQLVVRQVVSPVLWETSMRYLLDEGVSTFYEVGPGRVLRGLLKRIDRKVECLGVEV